jgi:hypothetical protein
MESIRIDVGKKQVCINDDPNRVIEFNPSEVAFADRFYMLIHEFDQKYAEYQRKAKELDKVSSLNELGLPENLSERLTFVRELCESMRTMIDSLFGAGTSQKAFGDVLSLEAICQFFEGITPIIQKSRSPMIAKYTRKRPGSKVMK